MIVKRGLTGSEPRNKGHIAKEEQNKRTTVIFGKSLDQAYVAVAPN